MNQEDAMKMISRLEHLSYKDREGERSEVVLPGEVSDSILFGGGSSPPRKPDRGKQ